MTPKGRLWRVGQSWWILLTFTLYFNWVAFFYIASRTGVKRWAYWGLLYGVPFMLIYLDVYPFSDSQIELIGLGILVSTIASIIHAFIIRNEFLYLLEVKQINAQRMYTETNFSMGTNYEERLVQPEPQRPPSVAERSRDLRASMALDLNTASEDDIANLPGVGIILAKKAIQHRDNQREYRSVEEFFQVLGLKQHTIERITPLITVRSSGNPSGPAPAAPSGRVVDM